MGTFGFTLVIDAGSVVSLILWIIGIIVVIGLVIFLLGAAGNILSTVDEAVDSVVNSKTAKKNLSIGQVLGYSALSFILGSVLTFLLIEVLPEDLWFIAIIPFFTQFFLWYYFANRLNKDKK